MSLATDQPIQSGAEGRAADPADSETRKRLGRKIRREMGRAIHDFGLIRDGDRILVAVSGGKDSLCMLHFLQAFQRKAPVRFEIVAVNLDQVQPGFPAHVLPALFEDWGVEFHIERQDTYSVVQEKTPVGKAFCSMCSRLRRGILYRVCREQKCNKLALGHHRDDLLSTFLMNAFFSGKLATMPPIYTTEEGDLQVIRPLFRNSEKDLGDYATLAGWPIIPCTLCGSQSGLKRAQMEGLLKDLEAKHPGLADSLFGAVHNPHLEQLLDRSQWADADSAHPRGLSTS